MSRRRYPRTYYNHVPVSRRRSSGPAHIAQPVKTKQDERIDQVIGTVVFAALLVVGYLWMTQQGPFYPGNTVCNDGTRTHSTGSGTCSWHRGINYIIQPTPQP